MPNTISQGEIDLFVQYTKAVPYPGGLSEADNIVTRNLLVYYEDVITCIYRQLELIQANNAYLTKLIGVFDDTELQAVGIWNNKTLSSSPPLTDPVLIINSTIDLVILTPNTSSPPAEKTLGIFGNSVIGLIVLDESTTLDEIMVGPGSIVQSFDASAGETSPPASPSLPANVETIWLPFARSTPSRMDSVVYGSRIGQVVLDEGSYYGGVKEDPDITCAYPVTNLTASQTVKNGVSLSWDPPISGSPPIDNYLFINTFFKKSNNSVWIQASEVDGDFVGDTGFVFRHLESDTFYDFKVSSTCVTGGVASETITIKTGCCGSGNTLTTWKKCEFTLTIAVSPITTLDALCNGAKIAIQYPEGTTLTVPYFIGRKEDMDSTLIINNVPYQNFPFDDESGQWDASQTSLQQFIAGNIVTGSINLPL